MTDRLGRSHAATEAWCCPTCGRPCNVETEGLLIGVRAVTYHGQTARLTWRQLEVVRFLARRFGTPVHRNALYAAVWGETDCLDKIVDVYMCHLRKVLAPIGLGIETFYGVGFALKPLDQVPVRKRSDGRVVLRDAGHSLTSPTQNQAAACL